MVNRALFQLLERVYHNEDFNHKEFYQQFIDLQSWGFIEWVLGSALITQKGVDFVEFSYWD